MIAIHLLLTTFLLGAPCPLCENCADSYFPLYCKKIEMVLIDRDGCSETKKTTTTKQ